MLGHTIFRRHGECEEQGILQIFKQVLVLFLYARLLQQKKQHLATTITEGWPACILDRISKGWCRPLYMSGDSRAWAIQCGL